MAMASLISSGVAPNFFAFFIWPLRQPWHLKPREAAMAMSSFVFYQAKDNFRIAYKRMLGMAFRIAVCRKPPFVGAFQGYASVGPEMNLI
jgi:hypothetical protein